MKRTIVTPVVVAAGFILMVVLMAITDVFTPVIQFLHTGEITLLQALWCLVASVIAFGLALKLLIMLGEYFLPRAEKRRQEDGKRKK
jgi:membrane protein implicated in regulation of membrane protease activity